MSWFAALCHPATLAAAASRVARRADEQGNVDRLLRSDEAGIARAIGDALRKQERFWSPARVRWAMLDRRRQLFELALPDRIVCDAFADWLGKQLEPLYSSQLFSYRPKRSSAVAQQAFLDYLAAHRRANPDIKTRGLFVLRSDVKSYGDSIPVDPASPIWSELDAICPTANTYQRELLTALVRPTRVRVDEGESSDLRGVAIGTPLATVLTNFFLMPLDAMMAEHPVFYARYGDDVLIAHPAHETLARAESAIVALLAQRGLALSPNKTQHSFFNGAGRVAASHPDVAGRSSLDYLGTRVHFAGTIALANDKLRTALGDLRTRLASTDRLLRGRDRDARAKALIAVVQAAFSSDSTIAAAHAPWLQTRVSDRAQLEQIDYLIALQIAELLSGQRGPRAFRSVPYQWLRATAELPSLVVMRNRGERGAPAR